MAYSGEHLHDIWVIGCGDEHIELPEALHVVLEVGAAVRELHVVPETTHEPFNQINECDRH